jgi:hypothetical protein
MGSYLPELTQHYPFPRYRRVRREYLGVRGVDGPDSTGVSTNYQATRPCFRGPIVYVLAPLTPIGPFRRAVATLR